LIVVDTSALMAIIKREIDAEVIALHMAQSEQLIIGAPTKFELLLVAAAKSGMEGMEQANALLDSYQIQVMPWDDALAELAAEAFLRFGKGRHPAKLNFGDCMAYALAKSLDAPLLYKGSDFAQTDVASAV
jgi:ribonuclease VapC